MNDIAHLFAPPTFPKCPTRPYVIAEVGVNHEGNFDLAKRLIDEAKLGGADAVKFQTYKAGTLACKVSPSYWDTNAEACRSQHELFSRYDKFWKGEYEELKNYCDQQGVLFCSTPFDIESVDFLDPLMPFFKIASADLTNRPFIEHICSKGKPIILSTGASTLEEVQETVGWIASAGVPLALLHCVLNYPTPDPAANLGMIIALQREFPKLAIGYSDHTLPADMKSLELAVMLGATILEKHFTHDKTLPGNDHYHAMDWKDLKHFRELMDRDFTLMGTFEKIALASEDPAREHARRSLVSAVDIKKGEVITAGHLTFKRPAHGISPALQPQVIGRTALCDIPEDQPLQWQHLSEN
jgi:sialic acid synthase SpsE